jgi:hypothetical protein
MSKFKVGDRVRIKEKPVLWASSAGGECPLYLGFPFEGTTEVEKGNYTAVRISG